MIGDTEWLRARVVEARRVLVWAAVEGGLVFAIIAVSAVRMAGVAW